MKFEDSWVWLQTLKHGFTWNFPKYFLTFYIPFQTQHHTNAFISSLMTSRVFKQGNQQRSISSFPHRLWKSFSFFLFFQLQACMWIYIVHNDGKWIQRVLCDFQMQQGYGLLWQSPICFPRWLHHCTTRQEASQQITHVRGEIGIWSKSHIRLENFGWDSLRIKEL